jgi:hypothetical protein
MTIDDHGDRGETTPVDQTRQRHTSMLPATA